MQLCDALKNANYVTAYGMFSSALQGHYQQAEFTQGAQALDAPNSDTGASLTVSLTRVKKAAVTASVALDIERGAWKVDGFKNKS